MKNKNNIDLKNEIDKFIEKQELKFYRNYIMAGLSTYLAVEAGMTFESEEHIISVFDQVSNPIVKTRGFNESLGSQEGIILCRS